MKNMIMALALVLALVLAVAGCTAPSADAVDAMEDLVSENVQMDRVEADPDWYNGVNDDDSNVPEGDVDCDVDPDWYDGLNWDDNNVPEGDIDG